MIKIDIRDLEKNPYREVELQPSAGEVDVDADQFSDIHLTVHVMKRGDRIDISFEVRGVATLECDRTLQMFDQEVEGDYTVSFIPGHRMTEEDREDESVRELTPGDAEVDITKEVRDTLLLSLPLRKVAPQARDQDIQLQFGDVDEDEETDEEVVDPRWEKLKKLKSDSEDE